MNRRTLITSALRAGFGLLAVGTVASAAPDEVSSDAVMTFAPSSWRIETARRMVKESGEMWLAVRERYMGRNPILVGFDDHHGVEITRARNHWKLTERNLTAEEIAERDECREYYRAAFNPWPEFKKAPLPRIGDALEGKSCNLRAWIKNGRKECWSMSIETPNQSTRV